MQVCAKISPSSLSTSELLSLRNMSYGHHRASSETTALSWSRYIKDILTREFEDMVGFHFTLGCHSDLVYDTSGSGSYVRKQPLSSIGVSSEQLVHNVAVRLRDDINSVQLVPWPPRVEELEEEEELSPLMVQLLSSLRGKKGVYLYPSRLSHVHHHTVCYKATYHYHHQCYRHNSLDGS